MNALSCHLVLPLPLPEISISHSAPDVEVGTSGSGVEAILSQHYGCPAKYFPCAFLIRKLIQIEIQCGELWVVGHEWRHWFEGSQKPWIHPLLCQSGASGDDIAHLQCMLRTPYRNPLLIRLHSCVCWNFSLHYFLGLVSSVITQRSTTGSIWTIFILGIGSSCPPKTSAPQVSWPLKSFTTIPFCELSTLINTFIGILWVMGPWCVELLVRGGFREP